MRGVVRINWLVLREAFEDERRSLQLLNKLIMCLVLMSQVKPVGMAGDYRCLVQSRLPGWGRTLGGAPCWLPGSWHRAWRIGVYKYRQKQPSWDLTQTHVTESRGANWGPRLAKACLLPSIQHLAWASSFQGSGPHLPVGILSLPFMGLWWGFIRKQLMLRSICSMLDSTEHFTSATH